MEIKDSLPSVTLILGGARSGKSFHAEQLVSRAASKAVYIATAMQGDDSEMQARIKAHQERRDPTRWELLEEPLELPDAITRLGKSSRPILVDCLPLWLANLLQEGRDPHAAVDALGIALQESTAPVVCVSGEVGLGMTPLHSSGRIFRDRLGELNQHVATLASSVIFMLSGVPLAVKSPQA